MRPHRTSGIFLGLQILAMTTLMSLAQAQDDRGQSTHIQGSVYQDIMPTIPTESPDGGELPATKRMVDRCIETMLSIRERRDGAIRGYRMSYGAGYCLGWINATMALLKSYGEGREAALRVCMPDDVTSRQVAEIFLDYMDSHTDFKKYNPTVLIYWALLEKYPCAN